MSKTDTKSKIILEIRDFLNRMEIIEINVKKINGLKLFQLSEQTFDKLGYFR